MNYSIKWTGQTLNAVTTELLQASGSRLTIAVGDVLRIEGTVVAVCPTTMLAKEWEYSCLIKNDTGSTSFVGTPIVTDLRGDAGTESWVFDIEADDANEAFILWVTGQTGTIINWNAFGSFGDTISSVSPDSPTLKTQIDSLIGTGITAAEYNPWVEAGARTIVDILKPEDMQRHSTSYSVPSVGGLNVVLYRIWRVLVGGNTAIQRDEGQSTQVGDSNSFYKASVLTPAYIISAGIMKCYNGAALSIGNMIGIKYPTGIDTSIDTEIEGVPENLHYAVVLYAAIQGRIQQLTTLMKTTMANLAVPSFSASSIAVPSAITITTVGYTDASHTAVSHTDIGEMPAVPTFTPAVLPVEIEESIVSFDAATNSEDIELAQSALTKAERMLNKYQMLIQENLGSFNKEMTRQKADIDKVLQEAQTKSQEAQLNAKNATDVAVQNASKEMEALISDNVAKIQKLQADIQKYGQTVNAYVSTYQADIQTYQANIAKVAQQHSGMLAGIQQLQSEYHSLIDLYLGRNTKQPQQDQNN